jgi:hypothetical protein
MFRNQRVSLGIEKNEGRLFRRPKLTLSCSAERKEGRKEGKCQVQISVRKTSKLKFLLHQN